MRASTYGMITAPSRWNGLHLLVAAAYLATAPCVQPELRVVPAQAVVPFAIRNR